jgi:hypothetical protein
MIGRLRSLNRRQRAWRDSALGLGLAAIAGAAWYRVGGETDAVRVAAIAIFGATYLVIAIGRLPGFHIDRAGSALVGAALILAAGAVSLDETMQAIRSRCCWE